MSLGHTYRLVIAEPVIDQETHKEVPEGDKEASQNQQPKNQNYHQVKNAIQITGGIPNEDGDGTWTELSGLQITGRIRKTKKKEPNTLEISIYNPSPETRAKLEIENAFIALDLGYADQGEPENVFVGQVSNVEIEKRGTEYIAKVQAVDGGAMYKNQWVSRYIEAGTPVAEVIRLLALDFRGVVSGHFALDDITETFSTGQSFFGLLSQQLTKLTKSYGLDWCIDNGKVWVFPQAWGVLTKNSGGINKPDAKKTDKWQKRVSASKSNMLTNNLLLEPENTISAKPTKQTSGVSSSDTKNTFGATVVTPIIGAIPIIGTRVTLGDGFKNRISGQGLKGDYTINALTHNFDYEGTAWRTTFELDREDKGES